MATNTRQQGILLWALMSSILVHLVIILGIVFVAAELEQKNQFLPIEIILVDDLEDAPEQESNVSAQKNNREKQPQIKINPPSLFARSNPPVIVKKTIDSILVAQNDKLKVNNQQLREQIQNDLRQTYVRSLQQLHWEEKYVTAHTKENKFAEYIEHWRLMVEYVGNLNYPEIAKQQQLEGELVLDVAINKDGSLAGIQVLKSSGMKALDDAAKRIVHIAAPFDRFPDMFKNEVNRLHIVRTWIFSNKQVHSRGVTNG